jgi:hypothetical protein
MGTGGNEAQPVEIFKPDLHRSEGGRFLHWSGVRFLFHPLKTMASSAHPMNMEISMGSFYMYLFSPCEDFVTILLPSFRRQARIP